MIGPLDTQVLVNRTLDVQRIQGNVNQIIAEESQIQKERLDNQIRTEAQRVQRKNEASPGRIQEQEKRREEYPQPKRERKPKTPEAKEEKPGKNPQEWRGRYIDLEL